MNHGNQIQDESLSKAKTGVGDPYWDDFYRWRNQWNPLYPTQFAAFIIGELESRCLVYDFGCGSGRDTIFFALAGHKAIGIDKSKNAIALANRALRKNSGADLDIRFMRADVRDDGLAEGLAGRNDNLKRVVYSRFFLHAVNLEAEDFFLRLAGKLCRVGDLLALEFRTIRDSNQKKVTPSHFRRYLNPLAVMERCVAAGFSPHYFIEGFGFAKYRNDDAHVARCLLERK